MPTETRLLAYEVPMPSRGLFTAAPGMFIDPRFSPFVDNLRFYKGEVLNRPGLRYFPDPQQRIPGVPTAGHLLVLPDRTYYTMLGTGGSNAATRRILYYDTAGVWTDITGSATFTHTSSDPWAFASSYSASVGPAANAYFTNGIDALYKWSGSGNIAAVADALAYPARYLVSWSNKLVMAHTVESGSTLAERVRWSDDGDAEVWTPTATNRAGASDRREIPGEITGMQPYGAINYIFKRSGIIAMRDTGQLAPAYIFQTAVDGIGTLCGGSIVNIHGMMYFLGEDDIYAFDGASRPVGIGTGIRDELFGALNYGRVRQVFAFHHAVFNEYWLFIPTGTSTDGTELDAYPNRAYIYNYIAKSWGRADINATAHVLAKSTGEFLTIDELDFPIDSWVTAIDSGFGGSDVYFPVLGQPNTLDGYTSHVAIAGNATDRVFTDATSEYIGQSFAPGGSIAITHIKASLRTTAGSPTGEIECAIYDDSGGEPNVAVTGLGFDDFSKIKADSLSGTFADYIFAVPAGVTIPNATHYVVFRHLDAVAGNTVALEENNANPYASGLVYYDDDGSPTWSVAGGSDLDLGILKGETGNVHQIDDNVIADGLTPVTAEFHGSDVRFYTPPEPPIEVTVHRVILTVRDRGSGTYTLELSSDGGKSWTAYGTKTTPSATTDALVNLVFPTRFTGTFVRPRITSSDPIAIQKITYEYFKRTEIQ
jgi:hypothetical protein